MEVCLTVDVEVWPVHADGWPHRPLRADQNCEREIAAYILGETVEGRYGLPYQLDALQSHGLRATYFVDPMSSYALGIDLLREIVSLVQGAGQRVELHLHPEWLSDPRCDGLPAFRGPWMSDYDEDTQVLLLQAALHRLVEAGARPPAAFRAGGWGAGLSTLRALQRIGILIDASLNACHPHSMRDLPDREHMHAASSICGVTELPITRFDDGASAQGRPLSIVGVSFGEMRHVLHRSHALGAQSCVVVLHSNEFVRTERLWAGRPVVPRRLIARRFERLCRLLADESDRLSTSFVADCAKPLDRTEAPTALVRTGLARTLLRSAGQVVSRWY